MGLGKRIYDVMNTDVGELLNGGLRRLDKFREKFDEAPLAGKAAIWAVMPMSTYLLAGHYALRVVELVSGRYRERDSRPLAEAATSAPNGLEKRLA